MRRATGTLHVFTFKEGALARVAHDLRLRIERFEIELEEETIRAEFDLLSLFVDGPVQEGRLEPEPYDAAKRAEVEKILHQEVLRTREHSRASFSGNASARGTGFRVEGELFLRGEKAPIGFDVRLDSGTFKSEFELRPSAWGIAPYRALFGAIRLKDVLRIELAVTESRI